MDAAIDGAVLVSFGSLANSSLMPIELKTAFIETFKVFPKVCLGLFDDFFFCIKVSKNFF